MSMDIKQCLCSDSFHMQDDAVLQINKDMLDDFCAHSTETEQFHALFNLQKEYMALQSKGKQVAAAHLGYMISYYLSVVTTLPRAEELMLYYATAAVEMDPRQEYMNWLNIVGG